MGGGGFASGRSATYYMDMFDAVMEFRKLHGMTAELTREEAARTLADGFLPMVAADVPAPVLHRSVIRVGGVVPEADVPAALAPPDLDGTRCEGRTEQPLRLRLAGGLPGPPDVLIVDASWTQAARRPDRPDRLCARLEPIELAKVP